MKKLAVLLTALSLTVFAGDLHAQPQGTAASNGSEMGMNFAWGIGLGGLAILATMAGLVGSSSSTSPTTFSHS